MITLNLRPELEAGLLAQARASGTTPEDYLRHLVERDLPSDILDSGPAEGTGMVWEDGLLVYGAGTALCPGFVDNALRRLRERSQPLVDHHNFDSLDHRED